MSVPLKTPLPVPTLAMEELGARLYGLRYGIYRYPWPVLTRPLEWFQLSLGWLDTAEAREIRHGRGTARVMEAWKNSPFLRADVLVEKVTMTAGEDEEDGDGGQEPPAASSVPEARESAGEREIRRAQEKCPKRKRF